MRIQRARLLGLGVLGSACVCAAAVVAFFVMATPAVAGVADGHYVDTDVSDGSADVDFEVDGNKIVAGIWQWPSTCSSVDIEPYTQYLIYELTRDDPPIPIDGGGHFLIQVDRDVPNDGFPDDHFRIEGTIDGGDAHGTSTGTTANPDVTNQHCESAIVPWTASNTSSGGGSSPACTNAKNKVAVLKAKLKGAEGAKRKQLLKKLKKAKERKNDACG